AEASALVPEGRGLSCLKGTVNDTVNSCHVNNREGSALMGRIASAFKRLGKVGEAALIPYVAAGYPSLDVTRQLVPVIARQGADLIQLGVPLSDPVGDTARQ